MSSGTVVVFQVAGRSSSESILAAGCVGLPSQQRSQSKLRMNYV